jgi:MFS transporter, DHA2 family, multidrug resistance protein
VLVLRGLAMGLMMMPVMTVSMDTIAPMKIPRASALSNVLRQVFSVFGTGITASVLLDRTHYHGTMLAQTVTPSNPAAITLLSASTAAFL